MGESLIRFLHLSDTHFGVHYALKPRNLLRRAYGELFFRKVEKAIREAISTHKIDFIIHSGDFFNRSILPPEVLDRGVKPFQLAARKGIPVFIIPGNHERSRLPLGLLPFSNDNLNLFADPCSYFFKKNGVSIKITGFPYIRHKACNTFSEVLRKAWDNSSSHNTRRVDCSILMVHQLFAGSRVEDYTFSRGNDVVPMLRALNKFDYIACGHVHRFQFLYEKDLPILKSTNRFYSVKQDYRTRSWHFDDKHNNYSHFPNPVIAYAGSLERVSFMERNEPKGYLVGELKPSKKVHGTVDLNYRFHELSAVRMIHNIWDLSKSSINDYFNKTLEELYSLHSTCKLNRDQSREDLTGVIRIKIKGQRLYNKTFLDILKEEAKRLRFYLTIRVCS